MKEYIIAIDQGTTSTRAMAFSIAGEVLACHQVELKQYFPHSGWVEHDGEEIWQAVLSTTAALIAEMKCKGFQPLAIGITNQRETSVLWHKKTGKPLHKAIVWQDRRTASICDELKRAGHEKYISSKTGLLLDPYFSGTKIKWMLEHNTEIKDLAAKGEVAFGTIESYLLFRLTGGEHLSDATNASRTLLCDIEKAAWDDDICQLLDIPLSILPQIVNNADQFGTTSRELFGEAIAITGLIGDQQSAAIGQGCFRNGSIKSTYGTGCFVLQNTGDEIIHSKHKLLSTIAYRLGGKNSYAIEGSIFMAGAAVQWLRDGLGIIKHSAETEARAAMVADNGGVYVVPAFTGLGAPHWDAHARAAIVGLERDSNANHIIRATLESVAYQTHDLFEAMTNDGAMKPNLLRVDGGMVNNNWFTQFLANCLDIEIERPKIVETTALGAAIMAGIGCGIYSDLAEAEKIWQLDKHFFPTNADADREKLLDGWNKALKRCLLKP
jgi:glycerol kinase